MNQNNQHLPAFTKGGRLVSMNTQTNILIAGAGRIGQTIAAILSSDANKQLILIDEIVNQPFFNHIPILECSSQDTKKIQALIKSHNIQVIVSCLPYFCNVPLAKLALDNHCHYFDLTEDIDTTSAIFTLAKEAKTAFMPQCGVAPGLVNIITQHLINQQKGARQAHIYCGALPQDNRNALGYALNWSTDGLINEYGNPCRILKNGAINEVPGLSSLEDLTLFDSPFEAFCTSGGIGTLVDTFQGNVDEMVYKTIRYKGHCEKMRFLMRDLKLNDDRATLKTILEKALPKNTKDWVITHVQVDKLHDTRCFYPTNIAGNYCSAIQAVTATSACAVIDTILHGNYCGPIKQEALSLNKILNNQHASYLRASEDSK